MNILSTVNSGSTMTYSPDFRSFTNANSLLYCSAHIGVTFALIPPVPRPCYHNHIVSTIFPFFDARIFSDTHATGRLGRRADILRDVVLTMMTIDAINPPKAVPEWIDDGIAVVTKTVRPTM